MIKLAILYSGNSHHEHRFQEIFEAKGIQTQLQDVNKTIAEDLTEYKIVLNRVYASSSTNNPRINQYTIKLLEKLEEFGHLCLDGKITTNANYSKSESARLLKQQGIRTPNTIKIRPPWNYQDIKKLISRHGFPVIIKNDTGGHAEGVQLINNLDELKKALQDRQNITKDHSGFVMQEFIKSNKPYDIRIGIINGNFAYAFSRSLISIKGEKPWLASSSLGSTTRKHYPTIQEVEIAKKSSSAINAFINEVDIALTNRGPVIIENNPTPDFVHDAEHRINIVADAILSYAYERNN